MGVKQRYIDACKDKCTGSGGGGGGSSGSGNDSVYKYGACIQTLNLNRSNQTRSVNYLHSDCSSDSTLNEEREPEPIYIESHIEYFHDQNQGMDIVLVKERAHWFVLKLLQPNIRMLSCRIEPVMVRIVEVGEKTIADAITVEEEAVVGEERGMKSLYVLGSMTGSGSGIDCSSEGKFHLDGGALAQ